MVTMLLAAVLVGPPAPSQPTQVTAAWEARLAEVRRVADGTFLDAAIIAAGSGFDVWATERCISRNPSCYEVNPFGKDSGAQRLALKAGLYPVKVGGCYILRRLGHHNWARGAAFALTAFDGYLGARALKRAGRR